MTRRHERVRLENARVTNGARRHRFETDTPVPFRCECDDDSCDELIRLTLPAYDGLRDRRLYIVSPGHRLAGAHLAESGAGFDGYFLR